MLSWMVAPLSRLVPAVRTCAGLLLAHTCVSMVLGAPSAGTKRAGVPPAGVGLWARLVGLSGPGLGCMPVFAGPSAAPAHEAVVVLGLGLHSHRDIRCI